MLRKMKIKSDRTFLILFPENILVEKGKETVVTVNNKEHADQLIELGFSEVQEKKNKEGDK